jgi:hypothetical protein
MDAVNRESIPDQIDQDHARPETLELVSVRALTQKNYRRSVALIIRSDNDDWNLKININRNKKRIP